MDLREKLVELMEASTQYVVDLCEKNQVECDNCIGKVYGNGCGEFLKADYLIAHGVTLREWISVKDRLPEVGTMVLVRANGKPHKHITLEGAYELAEYDPEGWILEMWPEWMEADVTHWMPLPMPPKEGAE